MVAIASNTLRKMSFLIKDFRSKYEQQKTIFEKIWSFSRCFV